MSAKLVHRGIVIPVVESLLTHPAHADGLAHQGDAVVVGSLAGVVDRTATSTTDVLPVLTEGVVDCPVSAVFGAVAFGDKLYIDPATALVNKDSSKTPFGIALGAVAAGVVVIEVKLVQSDAGASGGLPGGLDTQVQFNDGGVFGGAAGATWNKAVNQLTIGSDAALPSGFQLLNYLGTNVSLELAASAHEASVLYLVAASDGGGEGFISPLYLVASATADIFTQGFTCDVYGFDGGTKATVGFESDANSGAASSGFTAGAAAGGTAGAGATGNIAGFAVKSGIGLNFKSVATTPVMADFYAGVPTTALATINAAFYTEDFAANWAFYSLGGKSQFAGVIQPDADNTRDLGTSSLAWREVFAHTFKADAAVIIPNIPAADPHVVGQLYSVAGTVHVSAG